MSSQTEGAQSIARAALLLRTLSTFGSTGASLMQITTLTGLPKATVHRMLAAMTEERLVERPTGTRSYRIGPDIFAFGVGMQDTMDMRALARQSLERLASESGMTAYLGVRSGYDMLCLDKAGSESATETMLLDVHDRWPIGIGSFSLALLAFLPEAEMAEVIRFNQRRIKPEETSTFRHIERSIQTTRRSGYAKRKMRSYKGLAGVAAPVFDDRNYPIATLCVVSAATQMAGSALSGLAGKLKREAALINRLYEASRLQQQQREKWRIAVRGTSGGALPE